MKVYQYKDIKPGQTVIHKNGPNISILRRCKNGLDDYYAWNVIFENGRICNHYSRFHKAHNVTLYLIGDNVRKTTFDKVKLGEYFWGTTTGNKYVKGIVSTSKYDCIHRPVGVCVETVPGHENNLGYAWSPESQVLVDRPLTLADIKVGTKFTRLGKDYTKTDMTQTGCTICVDFKGHAEWIVSSSSVEDYIPF